MSDASKLPQDIPPRKIHPPCSVATLALMTSLSVILALSLDMCLSLTFPAVPVPARVLCDVALTLPLPLVLLAILGVIRANEKRLSDLKESQVTIALAQETLLQGRENFRALAEAAHDGILIVGRDERYLFANRRAAEMTGYSIRALTGRVTAGDLIPPEDIARLRARLRDRLDGREAPAQYECRFRRSDGSLMDVEVAAACIQWLGAPASLVSFRDVTQRKRAEERLRASEERYRALAEAAEDVILIVNRALQVTYANPAAARLLGPGAGPLEGAGLAEILPPHVFERLCYGIRQFFEGGRPGGHERDYSLRNGKLVLSATFAPVRDAAGHVAAVLLIARDITERRRMEDALRESEARLHAAIESVPFDFWIMDADGRYSLINSTARAHWGDRMGRTIEETDLPEATLARWRENNQRAFAGETVRGHVEYTHQGQRKYYYEIITPIRSGGAIHGILGVNIDITEQRLAEIEAARRQAEAIQQRAESLAVTGRLAAGVAHEINNPLQGIQGQLRLLRDELPPDLRNHPRFARIDEAVSHIADTVRQLLDLHRRPASAAASCILRHVVEDLLAFLEPELTRAGVRTQTSFDPEILTVRMGAREMKQVLMNLSLNTRDAMPSGGMIGVTARQVGESAVIEVSDTGSGLPTTDLARLFSPFFSTKGAHGTGLGLTVCHNLVAKAGGDIEAENRPEGGAIFRITLPLA